MTSVRESVKVGNVGSSSRPSSYDPELRRERHDVWMEPTPPPRESCRLVETLVVETSIKMRRIKS